MPDLFFPLRTKQLWPWLLMLLPFVCRAQSFQHVQTYSTEQGLSNRQVRWVLQDRQGYMWFSTANGLNRFDGKEMVVFNTTHPVCPLSGNATGQLLQDRQGLLWVITNAGLDLLDPVRFQVRHLHHAPGNSHSLAKGSISSLYEDRSGTVWVSSQSGQLQKHLGNGKFETLLQLKRQAGELPDFFFRLLEDHQGRLWAASRFSGLYQLSRAGQVLRHVPLSGRLLSFGLSSADKALLLGTDEGLYRYQPELNQLNKIEMPAEYRAGYFLSADNGQRLWVLPGQGPPYLRPAGEEVFRQADLGERFQGHQFLHYCQDRNGNFWFGTSAGALKATLQQQHFQTYLAKPADSLRSWHSLRGLAEAPNGTIWMGSYGQLFRLKPGARQPEAVALPRTREGRNLLLIPYAILPDSAGLWIATEGEGLVRYTFASGYLQFFPFFSRLFPPKDQPNTYLVSLLRQPGGELWMGSYEGISFKAPATDSFYTYKQLYPRAELNHLKVSVLHRAEDGLVWAGTEKGLFALQPDTKQVVARLLNDPANRQHVISLAEDEAGTLWIGTKGGGLYRLVSRSQAVRALTEKEGLSDNVVNAIIPEGQQLWLSTDNGLNLFDTRTGTIRHFFLEDGLTANEFNHGSGLRTRAGEILLGGINGVNRFRGAQLLPAEARSGSPLLLTRLDYVSEATDSLVSRFANLQQVPALELPFGRQYLDVHFALADYTRPEKNQYAYKLEGYDKDWHYIGNQHYVRLLGLPAGRYTLRIKAAGSNGTWSSQELRVQLAASEAFYRTWWFLLLVFGLLAGIGAAFYFYRVRYYRRMLALRTRIATDLHDQVGSYLTRIAISSDMLREVPAGVPATRYVEQIAQSSRSAVATMSDVIWSIDSRSDTLGDLLLRVREHCQELFEPAGIAWELRTEGVEKSRRLRMEQRHNLFLIVKEATHNILKHAQATQALLSFQVEKDQLEITIADNGQPGENKNGKSGQGLRNMQLRARELKGSITIERSSSYTIRVKCKL